MSDSVRPHRWKPTRLPRLRDSPGKNTGVGTLCIFLIRNQKDYPVFSILLLKSYFHSVILITGVCNGFVPDHRIFKIEGIYRHIIDPLTELPHFLPMDALLRIQADPMSCLKSLSE